jgi:hypothetical protein
MRLPCLLPCAALALLAAARSAQGACAAEPGSVPVAPHAASAPYGEALAGVRDAQDFGETPGYRRLVELVAAERAGAARRLDVADALARPEAWRGQHVRVRGLVAWMRAIKLAAPLLGSPDVYRAVVTEPDGTEGVAVDFLAPPPPFELQRDVVEVEGVFFRTVRYENEADQQMEAPYVIAREIRRLDPDALPRRTAFDSFGRLLVVAALALLVVRVLWVLRRSRGQLPRRPPHDPRSPTPTRHAHL